MASPKVRRDTLRKAKAAYKKRGAPIITEKERRQLERRAELRDRAERIKAKEDRRRANKEKREKKSERDRETKERQGFKDAGPKLPEGQITLSGFVKKSRDGVQSETRTENVLNAEAADCDRQIELAEEPTPTTEATRLRRVRFVEPEVCYRARLPLRLRSPPVTSHPRTSQPAYPEHMPSIEMGPPLLKPTSHRDPEGEDWAALFPSDTQVGRELRDSPPSLDDATCHLARPRLVSEETSDVNHRPEELFLIPSVWDSFPSDTQVQRELDESPPSLPEVLNDADRSETYCASVTLISATSKAARQEPGSGGFRGSGECRSKNLPSRIDLMSSSDVEDFTDDEARLGKPVGVVDGLKAWSTDWLPSSTAEVSAFFDSDIDD